MESNVIKHMWLDITCKDIPIIAVENRILGLFICIVNTAEDIGELRGAYSVPLESGETGDDWELSSAGEH